MLTNIPDETEKHPCKNCGRKRVRVRQVETPPRPSCWECVEKHLGAAMVLLSEIHNGYERGLLPESMDDLPKYNEIPRVHTNGDDPLEY